MHNGGTAPPLRVRNSCVVNKGRTLQTQKTKKKCTPGVSAPAAPHSPPHPSPWEDLPWNRHIIVRCRGEDCTLWAGQTLGGRGGDQNAHLFVFAHFKILIKKKLSIMKHSCVSVWVCGGTLTWRWEMSLASGLIVSMSWAAKQMGGDGHARQQTFKFILTLKS